MFFLSHSDDTSLIIRIVMRLLRNWCIFDIFIGNRWLRGQKPKETLELLEVAYPSKRDKENWQFFKILECCNHFSSLGVGGSSSAGSKTPSASAVTLITANGQETATNDHLHVANSKGKTTTSSFIGKSLYTVDESHLINHLFILYFDVLAYVRLLG